MKPNINLYTFKKAKSMLCLKFKTVSALPATSLQPLSKLAKQPAECMVVKSLQFVLILTRQQYLFSLSICLNWRPFQFYLYCFPLPHHPKKDRGLSCHHLFCGLEGQTSLETTVTFTDLNLQ